MFPTNGTTWTIIVQWRDWSYRNLYTLPEITNFANAKYTKDARYTEGNLITDKFSASLRKS